MADRWSLVIISAGIVVAASLFVIILLSPPQATEWNTTGFPYCLRVLQCANIPEFQGIPFDQLNIIAKNYNSCFEDYKLEQTCNVQVYQDIERFHELGYVTER